MIMDQVSEVLVCDPDLVIDSSLLNLFLSIANTHCFPTLPDISTYITNKKGETDQTFTILTGSLHDGVLQLETRVTNRVVMASKQLSPEENRKYKHDGRRCEAEVAAG